MKKNGKRMLLNPTFNNIKKVIFINLLFMSLIAILFAGYIEFFIDKKSEEKERAKIIAIQSRLNQRISNNLSPKAEITKEIKGDVEVMARLHSQLMYGDEEIGLLKIENDDLKGILKDITPYQQNIYELLNQENINRLNDDQLIEYYRNQKAYQQGINEIIELQNSDSQLPFLNLRRLMFFLVASFIIIIFFNYRVFIRPVIRNFSILSEEKERQSAHIRSIVENTKSAIWSVDLNYNLLAFNSVFNRIMIQYSGVAPKIGEKVLGLTPFDSEPLYKKAFEGSVFSCDFEFKYEGKTSHHELSFHPIYDRNEQVTGCSVYQMEVTRRVVALQELKLSEDNLKEAQKIASLGNWSWDLLNGNVEWSEQLYEFSGKDPLTFVPEFEVCFSFIHPEDRERVKTTLLKNLENLHPHEVSYRIIRNDGEIRHLHTKAKYFYDENGKPVRMVGATQDVTKIVKAKARILKQNDELQNFVYIVSHNLRAPVSTLLGLNDLYNSSENDDLGKEQLVQMIGKTIHILDETLKDLNHTLTLKNITEEQFEEVDLDEIFNSIELLLLNDIESNNVQIKRDFSKVQKVFGVKAYFTNIFFNLVQNAIHYKSTNRAPRISIISNSTSNGIVTVSVIDNGIGMLLNDSTKKKIFDMYGRLSGSSNGKGMGLYLVKTQVEAMNGNIKVESNPDSGTVFTVLLNEKARKNEEHNFDNAI